jgi:hypothetical protein
VGSCEVDASGLGLGPVTGSCEHDYELTCSVRGGEFLAE